MSYWEPYHFAPSFLGFQYSSISSTLQDALDGLGTLTSSSVGNGQMRAGIINVKGEWTVLQSVTSFFTPMISFAETIDSAKLFIGTRQADILTVNPVNFEARAAGDPISETFRPQDNISDDDLMGTFIPRVERSADVADFDTEVDVKSIVRPASEGRWANLRFNSAPNRTGTNVDPRGLNHVNNPQFLEVRTNLLDSLPTGWLQSGSENGTASFSDDEAYVGSHSMKITPNNASSTYDVRYRVSFPAGKGTLGTNVDVKLYMKRTSDFNGVVSLRINSVQNLSFSAMHNEEKTITTSWALYDIDMEVTTDFSSELYSDYIEFSIRITGTEGSIYVDDVEFTTDKMAAGTVEYQAHNAFPSLLATYTHLRIFTTGAPDVGAFGIGFLSRPETFGSLTHMNPAFTNSSISYQNILPKGRVRLEPGEALISDPFVLDSTTEHVNSVFGPPSTEVSPSLVAARVYRGGRFSFGLLCDEYGDFVGKFSMHDDSATPVEYFTITIERDSTGQYLTINAEGEGEIYSTEYSPIEHRYIRIWRAYDIVDDLPVLLDDFYVELSPDQVGWNRVAVIEFPSWKNETFIAEISCESTEGVRIFADAFNALTNYGSSATLNQDVEPRRDVLSVWNADGNSSTLIPVRSRLHTTPLENTGDIPTFEAIDTEPEHILVAPKLDSETLLEAIQEDSYFEFSIMNTPKEWVDITNFIISANKTELSSAGFGFTTNTDHYPPLFDDFSTGLDSNIWNFPANYTWDESGQRVEIKLDDNYFTMETEEEIDLIFAEGFSVIFEFEITEEALAADNFECGMSVDMDWPGFFPAPDLKSLFTIIQPDIIYFDTKQPDASGWVSSDIPYEELKFVRMSIQNNQIYYAISIDGKNWDTKASEPLLSGSINRSGVSVAFYAGAQNLTSDTYVYLNSVSIGGVREISVTEENEDTYQPSVVPFVARGQYPTCRVYVYGASTNEIRIGKLSLLGWAGERWRNADGYGQLWAGQGNSSDFPNRPERIILRQSSAITRLYPTVRFFTEDDIESMDGSVARINSENYELISGATNVRLIAESLSANSRGGYKISVDASTSDPFEGGFLWMGDNIDKTVGPNKKIRVRIIEGSLTGGWVSFLFAASTVEWYEVRIDKRAANGTIEFIHYDDGVGDILASSITNNAPALGGEIILLDVLWLSEEIEIFLYNENSFRNTGYLKVSTPVGGPTSGTWGLRLNQGKFVTNFAGIDYIDIIEEF